MLALTDEILVKGTTKYEILDTDDFTKELITQKQLEELNRKGHKIEGYRHAYPHVRCLHNWYIESINTYILETTDINHCLYIYKDYKLIYTILDKTVKTPKSESQYKHERPLLDEIVLLKNNRLLLYFISDYDRVFSSLYFVDLNTGKCQDMFSICYPYMPDKIGAYLYKSDKASTHEMPKLQDLYEDWYYTGYSYKDKELYFEFKDALTGRALYIQGENKYKKKLNNTGNPFLSDEMLNIQADYIDRYIKIKIPNFYNRLTSAFHSIVNDAVCFYLVSASCDETEWSEFNSAAGEVLLNIAASVVEDYLKVALYKEICMILKDCNIATFDFMVYTENLRGIRHLYLEICFSNFSDFNYSQELSHKEPLYLFRIDTNDDYRLIFHQQ